MNPSQKTGLDLWLAARAEGIGVGWVSIFHPAALRDILGLPRRIVPVAYLCLGYVRHFRDRPDLEAAGGRERLPLESLVFLDRWGETGAAATAELRDHLRRDQQEAAAHAALLAQADWMVAPVAAARRPDDAESADCDSERRY